MAIILPEIPQRINNWLISSLALGHNYYISNGVKYSRVRKAERKGSNSDIISVKQEKILVDVVKRCYSEEVLRIEESIQEKSIDLNKSAEDKKCENMLEQRLDSEKSEHQINYISNAEQKRHRATFVHNHSKKLSSSIIEKSFN